MKTTSKTTNSNSNSAGLERGNRQSDLLHPALLVATTSAIPPIIEVSNRNHGLTYKADIVTVAALKKSKCAGRA
jgi:hypothetical protein